MSSGIYLITNTTNNKVYVGQSINLQRRFGVHRSLLKHNRHENEYLQRSYNKYGCDAFTFTILEYCAIDLLNEREIFWITAKQSSIRENGFNIDTPIKGSNKAMSEETKRKLSKRYQFLNPSGEQIEIVNLRQFCRDNNLHCSHMVAVARGSLTQHKGWKAAQVTTCNIKEVMQKRLATQKAYRNKHREKYLEYMKVYNKKRKAEKKAIEKIKKETKHIGKMLPKDETTTDL